MMIQTCMKTIKSNLLIVSLLLIGVASLKASDSLFVKRGLIISGGVTVASSVGLLFMNNDKLISPKSIPVGVGLTLIITGLFIRK